METPIVECDFCRWQGPATDLLSDHEHLSVGFVESHSCPNCGEYWGFSSSVDSD